MTLQEFADKYRLKLKKDSCDVLIIPGRTKGAKRVEDNHHVYEQTKGGTAGVAVYFTFPTPGRFNSVRRKLDQPGVFPMMLCKMDGFFAFDPENEPLVKLILKLAKIRVRRQLTDEQKTEIRNRFTNKS
jgi:hypothetical protein